MTDQIDEEPLDPKIEAIRQKMLRLLMISGGTMMLGLMAVLFAIVYKINSAKVPETSPVAVQHEISIPAGSKIIGSSLSDGNLLLTLQTAAGGIQIQVLNKKGELLRSYTIKDR